MSFVVSLLFRELGNNSLFVVYMEGFVFQIHATNLKLTKCPPYYMKSKTILPKAKWISKEK